MNDKKGHIAFRMKEGTKLYAPMRDITHCLRHMIKAALTVSTSQFKGDEDKIQALGTIALRLGEMFNKAKGHDKANVVVKDYIKSISQGIPADVIYVFNMNLTNALLTRYVSGIRETAESDEIRGSDLTSALVGVTSALLLPDELEGKVVKQLQLSNQIPRDFLADTNLFEEVPDIPDDPTEAQRIKEALEVKAARAGISVEEYLAVNGDK